MVTVYKAVMAQGAGYNPQALHEETGLPVDTIHVFAAKAILTLGQFSQKAKWSMQAWSN
jgi:hypothetical protein